MAKPAWKPWHEVVKLREDVRTGELSLSIFAADLHQVVMGEAKPVYQDPTEFFALAYPTYNLRELSKEVVLRLAGKNEKAIRQLALPYGGGKTHTLITLYHLVNDPKKLPDLPAVREFKEAIGGEPPRARVAALCFDKLDVEKGMEIRSPSGDTRWLKQPWSVLAFQLAGDEGLKIVLGEDGKERDTAPAENLLAQLLKLPREEGLSSRRFSVMALKSCARFPNASRATPGFPLATRRHACLKPERAAPLRSTLISILFIHKPSSELFTFSPRGRSRPSPLSSTWRSPSG